MRVVQFLSSLRSCQAEWSHLIGPDLVQILSSHWWTPYYNYAGAKYAITTHLNTPSPYYGHFVHFSVLLWHDKVAIHGKNLLTASLCHKDTVKCRTSCVFMA